MYKKVVFFVILLAILSIGPITVLRDTPVRFLSVNPALTINFFQRIAGLLAFTLIFSQIILGAWMNKLTEKLGGWVFKFHLMEGALAYLFILTHPLLFVLLNYKVKGIIDPFYVFTDFCVICRNNLELFYTLGRFAFWLVSIAVLAAELRTQPWLTRYWRYFHILNYLVFALVAVHSFFVGTDIHSAPFVYFYWIAVIGVTISFFYRRVYSEYVARG